MNDYILNFGTTVHCIDDQCGSLIKAAFDAENWHVSDLIVEEGFLLKRAKAFPFTAVEFATHKDITLSIHPDDLKNYPEYRETVIETVPENQVVEPAIVQGSPYGLATTSPVLPMVRDLVIEGVADHLDLLDKDTPVEAVDTTVGKVRGLAVAPENGLITHILVHRGTIFVEEFWLSTTLVERITTQGVFINLKKAELDDRIEYDEEREYYWDRMPTDTRLDSTSGSGPS